MHDRKTGQLLDESKVSEVAPEEEEPDMDSIENLRIRIPKNYTEFKELRDQQNKPTKRKKEDPT